MPKKRTAAESNNDEETTEDSDLSQQQGDAKRAKLVSLSDTTLEDLPIELLKCILVEVVAMEVKDTQFAKSVWKEKADLVINRLCSVCSQWNNICATRYFRNEVHRTLNNTAQKTIRFEIVQKYPIQFAVHDVTSVKDEIFMLCGPNGEEFAINVLDRNNMAEVKDVIPLPGISPGTIAGCSVSNCVYVHDAPLDESMPDSVLRITKVEEHQFTLSPWLYTDQKLALLAVSANGNLITVSKHMIPNPCVLSIYDANGSLMHKVAMYPEIYDFARVENVIQKANGNLVLVLWSLTYRPRLVEIDTSGIVVRRYQSSLGPEFGVNFADIYDRILITNWEGRFELLDSEFNLLDVSPVQPNEAQFFLPRKLHFNREGNEIMSKDNFLDPSADSFAIFRFIEV